MEQVLDQSLNDRVLKDRILWRLGSRDLKESGNQELRESRSERVRELGARGI